jgi:2-polyprenyl-3-methyl-5-hydroxy-6-metoxy-1,4-benzoquinol methylase
LFQWLNLFILIKDERVYISGETLDNVETAVEVLEHVAEVTEKLADNVAKSLPEDGSLQKVAVEIEYIAEVVDEDAHKVEAVIKKVCGSYPCSYSLT